MGMISSNRIRFSYRRDLKGSASVETGLVSNPSRYHYRPRLSNNGLEATREVCFVDPNGQRRLALVAGENALKVMVDATEVVTLMTLGVAPEKLVLGYLRNQRLVERIEDILSVCVDWQREVANVVTVSGRGVDSLSVEPRHRIITSGCGQGTIYSCTLDRLYEHRLPEKPIRQSAIYATLSAASHCNEIHRRAGSVHGCALVDGSEVLAYVEDVGRHNAMDTIAGEMWLGGVTGENKLFYTTGRLTSEIVMKAAMMGVPALISRNGVTRMAIELAEDLGVMLIARAKGRRFQVLSCHAQLVLDAALAIPRY